MKQTKLIAAALISALALTFAAGCNNGGEPAVTTVPDTAQSSENNTEAPKTSATTEAPEASGTAEAGESDLWANALYTEDTELGEGAIAVKVEVQAGDKSITFTVHTDKDNLGAALMDNKLVEGDQSEYGLYIKKVNGIKADFDTDGAWWGIFKDGEMTPTGADTTMIADGEHYELVYSK